MMNREERILNYNKADVTKIVTKKPSDTEGANGDFSIGSTANGVSLFAKINNKWHEFSSNDSLEANEPRIKGSVSYIYGGYFDTAHTNFLPMNGNLLESSSINESVQTRCAMTLPYDCRVISVTVRADVAIGSTFFYLYHCSNGDFIDSSNNDDRGEKSSTINCIDANKAYTFQFSGNNVIKAKSNLAFQINANGGSDIGDHSVNFAIILDYDTPV